MTTIRSLIDKYSKRAEELTSISTSDIISDLNGLLEEEVETYNLAIDHSIKIVGHYMTTDRMEPGERTLLNIVSEAIYKLKKP